MLPHSQPDPTAGTMASYLSKMHQFAGSTNPSDSGDVNLNNGPHGTAITLAEQYRIDSPNYRTTYDPATKYTLNDIIKVTASVVTVDSQTYSIDQGTYICIRGLPALTLTDYNGLSADLQSAFDYDNDVIQTTICYYPFDGIQNGNSSSYWDKLGGGGAGLNYDIYDYSSSYSTDQIIYYTGSTEVFWSGSDFANAEVKKWLYPGTYIATQAVASLEGRLTGSNFSSSFQMPYFPWEQGAYWNLISLYPTTMSVCSTNNATKTFYVDATEMEPANAIQIRVN